ncbi:MAG: hypothetical protein P8171_24345 [Candidatus Thiodiazotropha sp.]
MKGFKRNAGLLAIVMLFVMSLSSCVLTREKDATYPQVGVPATSGKVKNNSNYRVLVFCDGEVVGRLDPGETKEFDFSDCEVVGYTPVR